MTYSIKAFGHHKLIFIPQHLKEVQMSARQQKLQLLKLCESQMLLLLC